MFTKYNIENEKVDKSMEEKHIKIKIYHTSEINFKKQKKNKTKKK